MLSRRRCACECGEDVLLTPTTQARQFINNAHKMRAWRRSEAERKAAQAAAAQEALAGRRAPLPAGLQRAVEAARAQPLAPVLLKAGGRLFTLSLAELEAVVGHFGEASVA